MPVHVHVHTFNPFEENTYILVADNNDCIIIDPGCYDAGEQAYLRDWITREGWNPVSLINTHCHIDHILGNAFVANEYQLSLRIHQGELPVLKAGKMVAQMYGIPYEESPDPAGFISEHETIDFGDRKLKVLFAPGHSPASVCFFNAEEQWLIGGDVLFHESIGRTDLPGGNHEVLLKSIRTQLFTLPDNTVVHPGHGQSTSIGYEKMFNPFLQ